MGQSALVGVRRENNPDEKRRLSASLKIVVYDKKIPYSEIGDLFRSYWQKCQSIPEEFYTQLREGHMRITVLDTTQSEFLENFIGHLACQYGLKTAR